MNGLKLKEIRKKLNITQQELAEQVGITRKTINTYETKGDIPDSKQKLFKLYFESNNKLHSKEYDSENIKKSDLAMFDDEPKKGVPYYDVDFTASFLEVENPAHQIKNLKVMESKANIPPTLEQHKKIKYCLENNYPNFYIFILTIYHTGIRPNEILQLQLNMIDLEKQQIILPPEITKTNKERIVPINNHLLEFYKTMDLSFYPKDFYLFGAFDYNHKHRAKKKLDFVPAPNLMKRDTATKRWNKIIKKGLDINVNMYSYKHFGANQKILAGIDLDVLRELYGHSSKLMTMRYAKVVKEVYRNEIINKSPDF